MKFRSGAPAHPVMPGSKTTKKSAEASNAETAEQKSSLKKVTSWGESQSNVVGTALQKQAINEDAAKQVRAVFSSRWHNNWVFRNAPA